MRQIIITGRLGADAEQKITKQGNQYITFRIANTEFGDNNKTYWFRVTSFENRHMNMVKYLTKGKPVIVQGKYDDNIYQNKNNNSEISRDIIAYNIEFISTGKDENSTNSANNSEQTPKQTTNTASHSVDKAEQVQMPAFNTSASTASDDEKDDLPF